MSRSLEFGFINAKLRARISKLLPREWMMRMASMHSLSEAVAMLDGTRYESASQMFQKTGDIKMVEAEIVGTEFEEFARVANYLDGEPADFARALLREYEMELLKNSLRLWFAHVIAGRPTEDVLPYIVRQYTNATFSVDAVVNAPDETALLEALDESDYHGVVSDHLDDVLDRKSIYPLELALDRWYYSLLSDAVEELAPRDRSEARRLLGIRIDLLNLHWVARMKDFHDMPESDALASLLPGGTAFDKQSIESIYRSGTPSQATASLLVDKYGGPGSLTEESDEIRRLTLLSSMLQEILMHEVRHVLGGYPFTIGILLAYVFLRQNERRMIVTVINARFYEMTPERVGSIL